MKIAVLDGYTLNPGNLSWDELRALGGAASPPGRRRSKSWSALPGPKPC